MARTLTRRRSYSDAVLEEVRVQMARQRITQTDLAARLREGQPWVSRRLNARTPLTVDDLERIAGALRVPVETLLPRQDSNLQPAGYTAHRRRLTLAAA